MKQTITIPDQIFSQVKAHLFQSDLEQGAFLLAKPLIGNDEINLEAVDTILIPPEGWEVQHEVHLEMKDTERARLMSIARKADLAIVDCHSHPNSGDDVWFSPSDKYGIEEFAAYAKWKLSGKPYAAMVWGEYSLDGVIWYGDFKTAQRVDRVVVTNGGPKVIIPRGSWFRRQRSYWSRKSYER